MQNLGRVLYFSSQFPNSRSPHLGIFSQQRVLALQKAGVEVEVISPLLLNPPPGLILKPIKFYQWIKQQLKVPTRMVSQGITAYYPKWISPPKKIYGWNVSQFLVMQIQQKVIHFINSFQPDVIISSWLPDAVVISNLSHEMDIPIFSIADGTDVNKWPQDYTGWKRARKILNEKVDVLVFVSKALQDAGNSKGLFGKKNVVIHNAVDTDLFTPDNSVHKEEHFTILGIGRFVPLKGFDILLKAVSQLNQTAEKPIRLILVGDGPQLGKLRRQASILGISDLLEILMPMPQEKLLNVYRQANLFCLPSFSEGLPCVVLEAMACGLPIVASDVGGIAEIVNGNCGILVKPGDPDLLRNALFQAMNRKWNTGLIRREIEENFSFKIWVEKIAHLVESGS